MNTNVEVDLTSPSEVHVSPVEVQNDSQMSAIVPPSPITRSPPKTVENFLKRKLPAFVPPFKKKVHTIDTSGKAITEPDIAHQLVKSTSHDPADKTCGMPSNVSPKPGPSGIKITANHVRDIDANDSDSEDIEVDDKDLCCVCKRFSPPVKTISIYIVNWAQCDKKLDNGKICNHWVHTGSCVPSLRLGDRKGSFHCPHCISEQ